MGQWRKTVSCVLCVQIVGQCNWCCTPVWVLIKAAGQKLFQGGCIAHTRKWVVVVGCIAPQISGDSSWPSKKWGGARTSGVRPSRSLTGMEEYADRSWAGSSVVIVSTWLWLVGVRGICERGKCVREERVEYLCGTQGRVDVEEELKMCLHEKGTVLESGMCWYSGNKAIGQAV